MRRLVCVSLFGSLVMLLPLGGCGAPPADDVGQSVASQELELEMDMDGDEEADDASCRERCAHHARGVYQACKEAGGSDEECRARAAHALRECLERCRPECGDRCRAHAREVFRQCRADGGGPLECRARAFEAFRRCIRECRADGRPEMRPEPTPEQRACGERCREKARVAFKECVEAGNPREECAKRVIEGFRACLRMCLGRDDAAGAEMTGER